MEEAQGELAEGLLDGEACKQFLQVFVPGSFPHAFQVLGETAPRALHIYLTLTGVDGGCASCWPLTQRALGDATAGDKMFVFHHGASSAYGVSRGKRRGICVHNLACGVLGAATPLPPAPCEWDHSPPSRVTLGRSDNILQAELRLFGGAGGGASP